MDVDPYAPCPHSPGTEGKVLWLRARAALRLPLFHPDDERRPAMAEVVERVGAELGAEGEAEAIAAYRGRVGRMKAAGPRMPRTGRVAEGRFPAHLLDEGEV